MKPNSAIKLAFGAKAPRAPSGLGPAGRRLWKSIQAEYAISDSGGLAFLLSACRAEDDTVRMRQIVAKEGDTVTLTDKPPVAHPLLAAIRGMEQVKARSLRALNLDVEPLRDKPGRRHYRRGTTTKLRGLSRFSAFLKSHQTSAFSTQFASLPGFMDSLLEALKLLEERQ